MRINLFKYTIAMQNGKDNLRVLQRREKIWTTCKLDSVYRRYYFIVLLEDYALFVFILLRNFGREIYANAIIREAPPFAFSTFMGICIISTEVKQ